MGRGSGRKRGEGAREGKGESLNVTHAITRDNAGHQNLNTRDQRVMKRRVVSALTGVTSGK